MTERYTYSGAFIRVIGQPDLDANWQPVPGKPTPEGLVSRRASMFSVFHDAPDPHEPAQ